MEVKWKLLSRVQFFETPSTVACQALLSMGFSGTEYWSGVAFPFSRGSPRPRDWTQISHIAGKFFIIWAAREAQVRDSYLSYSSRCVYVSPNLLIHPTTPSPALVSTCWFSTFVSLFLPCKYVHLYHFPRLPKGTEYNPQSVTWAPKLRLHPLLPLPSFPTRWPLPHLWASAVLYPAPLTSKRHLARQVFSTCCFLWSPFFFLISLPACSSFKPS